MLELEEHEWEKDEEDQGETLEELTCRNCGKEIFASDLDTIIPNTCLGTEDIAEAVRECVEEGAINVNIVSQGQIEDWRDRLVVTLEDVPGDVELKGIGNKDDPVTHIVLHPNGDFVAFTMQRRFEISYYIDENCEDLWSVPRYPETESPFLVQLEADVSEQ